MATRHLPERTYRQNPNARVDRQAEDQYHREQIEHTRQLAQQSWDRPLGTESVMLSSDPTPGSAAEYAEKKVRQIMQARGKSYTDALLLFAQEEPDRALAYRNEGNIPLIGGVVQVAAEPPSAVAPKTQPNTTSARVRFDTLVDDLRRRDSKLTFAGAILLAAEKDPQLAKLRNMEIAAGVATMTSV